MKCILARHQVHMLTYALDAHLTHAHKTYVDQRKITKMTGKTGSESPTEKMSLDYDFLKQLPQPTDKNPKNDSPCRLFIQTWTSMV